MKKLFIFFLSYCFTINLTNAATCTAISGSWSTVGTWSCGRVPIAGDVVVIPAGITVTVSADVGTSGSPINNLTLNISGVLSLQTSGTDMFLSSSVINVLSGGTINLANQTTMVITGTSYVNVYPAANPLSAGAINGATGNTNISIGSTVVHNGNSTTSGPKYCSSSACSTTGGPLSVSLLSFKAILNNDQSVLLNWETISEQDSRYFLLNRGNSLDVLHEITRIDAAGQSTTRRSYSFTDAKAPLGTSYYQLSEVDNNGIVQSFRPVSIVVEDPNAPFGVFSNPSDNKLFRVKVENAESAILSLFTANGRAITFKITEESETVVMVQPNENLASGVYLLNVKNNGTERTHKIVIE